jgi:predicted metal-dependent HD superfamily phosphohydrolase
VEWALWFHDVVYDTKTTDNELQSAQWAERCLNEAKFSRILIQTVMDLILSTQHRGTVGDMDALLVEDIDLSILGQPEERFFEYERQIRQEYAWVSQATFAQKRAEILEGFLARPRLYATDWFHQKYEQTARRNLQQSLRRLNP